MPVLELLESVGAPHLEEVARILEELQGPAGVGGDKPSN